VAYKKVSLAEVIKNLDAAMVKALSRRQFFQLGFAQSVNLLSIRIHAAHSEVEVLARVLAILSDDIGELADLFILVAIRFGVEDDGFHLNIRLGILRFVLL
jgi:hypothetical protein